MAVLLSGLLVGEREEVGGEGRGEGGGEEGRGRMESHWYSTYVASSPGLLEIGWSYSTHLTSGRAISYGG